jgi:hypothetical protein
MATIVFQRVNDEWQVVAFGAVWLTTRDVELGGLCAAALHVRLLREQRIPDDEDVALGAGVTEEDLRVGYAQIERLELFERRAAQLAHTPPEALNE